MSLFANRYGRVTKFLHWALFLLILNQFVVAAMMFNTPGDETTAGFSQGQLYEWHKSIGLIALVLATARYVWRKTTVLPDWAPNLSDREKRAIHRVERTLYLCMIVMPISGFLFVMTGDFGISFFNRWDLPNLIGVNPTAAAISKWTHAMTATVLGAALFVHWGITLRHQLVHRDRYAHRMLPFTHQ